MSVEGYYDPFIVALSVAVAIFASFTALNLAGRLLATEGTARYWWLLSAAVALGGGIWSMHFVGMLAFVLPMPSTYSIQLTLLSLILPIPVTGGGLYVVCRFGTGWRPLLAAGLFVGLGVVVMHYVGMAAMQMPGVRIGYDRLLVAASVAIAIVAATAALWLAFRTRGTRQRLAAAVVMGFAIAGMHYTAMAAAGFTVTDHAPAGSSPVIGSPLLAAAVAFSTSALLLLGLITAYFDRSLSALTAREAVALEQSEKRYRALIENASDVVAILDCTGVFTYESSSAWHVIGYRSEEIVGRRFSDFCPPESIPDVQRFLGTLLDRSDSPASLEVSLQHRNGAWRDFEAVGKNLLHDPSVAGIVINLRDITERKKLIAQLETLSETDVLTRALNRRGFLKIAGREFERMRRSGKPMTVMVIDIDRFKSVNDTYGHAAGDLVLAMVADQCRYHTRTVDVAARFGGEEFVILLVDAAIETASVVAERLREAIAGVRISTIKGEVSVTASFGMAPITPRTPDVEAAIRAADEALYEAKKAGRNCIKTRA